MAEEFEGGVCGGNWPWNSSRHLFASSPCSLATNDVIGTFGWPNHDVMVTEPKAARSSDDSAGSTSDGGGSVVIQKPPPNGFEISPDWNQDLLNNSGRSHPNYSNFLINSNMNYNQHQSKADHESFSQINSSLINTTTCFPISSSNDHLSNGFPLNSASYNYTSSILQTLFDTDDSQLPQQSLLDYSSSCGANYHQAADSNGFQLPNFQKPSPMLSEHSNSHLPNAPLWNAAPPDFTQAHNFLPSNLNIKRPNQPNFGAKHQGKESGSVAKKGSSNEAAAFKRPRIETPSPLPTFKVRKEKLGDRITALQQLVSPFGKTDTASVLHEAIEYIKFLHDQVNALSTPYLKYGSPPLQRQQDKAKDGEVVIKDLNSRGLCLVPISSTFPVATETPSDFWTPTFGGNLN